MGRPKKDRTAAHSKASKGKSNKVSTPAKKSEVPPSHSTPIHLFDNFDVDTPVSNKGSGRKIPQENTLPPKKRVV